MLNLRREFSIVLVSLVMFFIMGVVAHAQTVRQIVMIDPAHGGTDTGVIGVDKVAEKDLTLAIALAVKKELSGDPRFEIVLTREADKTISLEERRNFVLKTKPALFLSLHVNAGFGRNASGFELYYPGFKNVDLPQSPAKQGVTDLKTRHLNETVKLARLVRQNMDILFPRKGRGLREADVPQLEGLNTPALIVEIGFATNPDEKRKLTNGKTQTEIARVLARSIKTYF